MSGWQIKEDNEGTPHIVPVDDLREHEPASCWCSPTVDNEVVIHHALDEREKFETGERKPS